MTENELVSQLQSLRNIHPDQKWVDLTRTRIMLKGSIFSFLNFYIPKPLAISAMAAVVAVFGGVNVYKAGLTDSEIDDSPALTASLRHVSSQTAVEVAEVQELAKVEKKGRGGKEGLEPPSSHTVVFNQEAEERENFQALLRARIEVKIAYVKDLFVQVENSESVREILQNQRRYEENFKIFGEGLDAQVKELLKDAESALTEGDLITALDLVNAIEKLIKN